VASGTYDNDDYFYIDNVRLYETTYENNGYIIDGTTIKDCTGDGLYVATNEARLTNLIVQGNDGKGIRIAGGTRNFVAGCACSDNGSDTGIANENQDNYYDGGIDTILG
jgi:parallel beta-helix repeat protein